MVPPKEFQPRYNVRSNVRFASAEHGRVPVTKLTSKPRSSVRKNAVRVELQQHTQQHWHLMAKFSLKRLISLGIRFVNLFVDNQRLSTRVSNPTSDGTVPVK
mmetsp:Transcript_2285/g.5332  ORF Transcript_2285/g.5332 Transcript_2285/m.5332 type:complete len:102 (+) Transcript_2285:3-308(+)